MGNKSKLSYDKRNQAPKRRSIEKAGGQFGNTDRRWKTVQYAHKIKGRYVEIRTAVIR